MNIPPYHPAHANGDSGFGTFRARSMVLSLVLLVPLLVGSLATEGATTTRLRGGQTQRHPVPVTSAPATGQARIHVYGDNTFRERMIMFMIYDDDEPIGVYSRDGSVTWDRPPGKLLLNVVAVFGARVRASSAQDIRIFDAVEPHRRKEITVATAQARDGWVHKTALPGSAFDDGIGTVDFETTSMTFTTFQPSGLAGLFPLLESRDLLKRSSMLQTIFGEEDGVLPSVSKTDGDPIQGVLELETHAGRSYVILQKGAVAPIYGKCRVKLQVLDEQEAARLTGKRSTTR